MPHTPGPWTVREDRYMGGPAYYVDPIGSCEPDVTLCVAVVRRYQGEAEAEANARLIAAAPDLLAALKLAVRYLEHPDVQSMPFALSAAVPVERAYAAIAKATQVVS